ncbi:HelD family protein [Saccharomonospora halophila]|uniref:HelD family protein n=1 Tax=Saccharomonospora halophila TaxID=129922 RepID=UPI00036A9300|nr:ATP-binding domain-containing protein [Saccharomonospora halophila]
MSVSPQHREPDHAAAPDETATPDRDEVAAEQRYVTMLYERLDAEREFADQRLTEALAATGGPPQARAEREAATATYSDRLAQLNSVEQGLAFGRLDFAPDRDTDSPIYIGRLGLFDEQDDYRPLLVDWRAPAARPFYLATAASPDGVRRRRHLRTLSRRVVGVDDEVLDLGSGEGSDHLGLAGEAALLAALERGRTGEMSDIVATIQAEQDRIIRADPGGVLVVQGGPGTGKTAVALHRAAYLLYTYRHQLTSRGVLVVGPNSTFLRYIGQVLPSLGETGVLLATVGELYPGLTATGLDTPEAAEIKGRIAMTEVLAAAVRDRQTVPDDVLEIHAEGEVLTLDRRTCERARARARDTLKPHNLARRVFVDDVLDALAAQSAARLESDVLDDVPDIPLADDEVDDTPLLDARDHATIRAELAEDRAVADAVQSLWPKLSPQELLNDLLTTPARLRSAARGHLTDDECRALRRDPGALWTPGDVPLLDELAELLAEDDTEARERRARREREEKAYAEGVLHVLEQDEEIIDEEVVRVRDVLDAELLAQRQEEGSGLTAAQRAARDRSWTLAGHVIVDEAQELSEMDWRLLMRRSPSRSMTVVGDVSQTGSAAGTSSWSDVLAPYVADRWRLRELTVNYRTPAEIMEVAARVLAGIDPALSAPVSVRETGVPPWQERLPRTELAARLPELVEHERARLGDGTLGVLCPAAVEGELSAELARAGEAAPDDPVETPRVSVLTVERAKGLEFDGVIVVAPDEIVAGSVRGANDLYVALTRATRRLGVIHTGEPLPALSGDGSPEPGSG